MSAVPLPALCHALCMGSCLWEPARSLDWSPQDPDLWALNRVKYGGILRARLHSIFFTLSASRVPNSRPFLDADPSVHRTVFQEMCAAGHLPPRRS